jgi:hypothetical protein
MPSPVTQTPPTSRETATRAISSAYPNGHRQRRTDVLCALALDARTARPSISVMPGAIALTHTLAIGEYPELRVGPTIMMGSDSPRKLFTCA